MVLAHLALCRPNLMNISGSTAALQTYMDDFG
uniref:Uncharacterized protein n=1 Tax=Anguilla anguilla TaxID=7936 RepID=A0A0E9U2S2_ANGAN